MRKKLEPLMRMTFRLGAGRIATFALMGLVCLVSGSAWATGPDPLASGFKEVGSKRVISFRLRGEPETLDWNRAHTTVENYLVMNLMDGLVGLDDQLKVVPALAHHWSVSADGRVYTFELRKDVKWSDGVPLTAADFVYSWKRLLSASTGAAYAYLLYDVEGAEFYSKGTLKDFESVGIKAKGTHQFEVRLNRPLAHWMYIPTFWVTFPMRQDIVEKYGEAWEKPGRMVTLGPYILASRDIGSRVVLKTNPHYSGPRGNVEEVHAVVVKDDEVALSLYESGQLDLLTGLSTIPPRLLASRKDYKTFRYLKTGYLGFANSLYPIRDVRLRKAIAMAIDKKKLARQLSGGVEAATSFIPPRMMGYSKSVGLPYDPEKAKALFRQVQKEFRGPPQLELISTNWVQHTLISKVIQEDLKKNLGLEVKTVSEGHRTFQAKLDLHMHALFKSEWAADYPDPDNFLSVFQSGSGNNRTAWKDKGFDDRISGARSMSDSKAREKVYLEAQKSLLEENVVIVPLYYESNQALIKPRLDGVNLNALNYLDLRRVRVK